MVPKKIVWPTDSIAIYFKQSRYRVINTITTCATSYQRNFTIMNTLCNKNNPDSVQLLLFTDFLHKIWHTKMPAITKILINSWYHIKATSGTRMEPLPLAINTRTTFIHQTHASSKIHAQHPAHTSSSKHMWERGGTEVPQWGRGAKVGRRCCASSEDVLWRHR